MLWLDCLYDDVKQICNTHKFHIYAIKDGNYVVLMMFNKKNKKMAHSVKIIGNEILAYASKRAENEYGTDRLPKNANVLDGYVKLIFIYAVHCALPQMNKMISLFGIQNKSVNAYTLFGIIKEFIVCSLYDMVTPILLDYINKGIETAKNNYADKKSATATHWEIDVIR